MTGRPIPTALKVLAGNPGRRPLNKAEPQPKREIPPPPAALKDKAREKYFEIAPLLMEMGVFTNVDGLALAMLVETYTDYLDARDELEAHGGSYYETSNKDGGILWRLHPAAGVVSDCNRQIRQWLVEFGKTPAARARLKVESGHEQADPAEKYFAKTG